MPEQMDPQIATAAIGMAGVGLGAILKELFGRRKKSSDIQSTEVGTLSTLIEGQARLMMTVQSVQHEVIELRKENAALKLQVTDLGIKVDAWNEWACTLAPAVFETIPTVCKEKT